MAVTDHIGEWTKLWQDAGLLAAQYAVGWPSRYAREAFELLRTVLLYQRNTLADYSEGAFHRLLRSDRGRLTTDNGLLGVREPLFRSFASPYDSIGGSHLASASVRLPMALSLVFRDCPAARSPFAPDMLKKNEPNEWERAGFWQAFNRGAVSTR